MLDWDWMHLSRRQWLSLLAVSPMRGQGVASRVAAPTPRGKPSGRPFHAKFTDVSARSGLTAPVIYGGVDHKDYILETVGCGCAFLDYDNDGWLDIFVLTGTRREGAPPGTTNRLYKNNRDGTFTDVTEKAGLVRQGWASAVTIADYNNDGFDDIFVTYWGQNVLYRNNGDETFTDVTAEAGLSYTGPTRWGAGCTFVDYDRDGHLDLFVSNYLEFDFNKVPKPGGNVNCNWKGVPVNCGPRGLTPARHWLYRNDGKGKFTDVSVPAGISKVRGSYGMTAVAADFTNDGWPDIYIACDSTPSILFVNNHDGTFREEALERGIALNEDGLEQAGMGLGIGDIDCDGSLDIFKTHFADDTNVLYRNDGGGNFEDVTIRSGLGVETRYIGWGAGIEDLDNDGWPDIFYVTGSVYPEIEKKLPAYPFKTPRIIFRNLGAGKLEEIILDGEFASRGCAFGDFDNDGDVDVLVVNLNEPPSLLRNDLSSEGRNNHWLKVKLVGTKSNRSAIGARVTATYGGRKQVRELLAQGSFYSVNDPRIHFGLGAETHADLEIRWPNGGIERLAKVKGGQVLTVRESS